MHEATEQPALLRMSGTPVKMPARGSITVASLPHVAPQMRWFSGCVAADFSPSTATPLSKFWQVMLLALLLLS